MPESNIPLKKRKIRNSFSQNNYEHELTDSTHMFDVSIICDPVFSVPPMAYAHQDCPISNQASHKVPQQVAKSNREILWNKRYKELVEFKIQHGHCNVPQRYAPNKAIGKWVHKQKQLLQNKGGVMREDRVEALNKIEFPTLSLPRSKLSWYERYAELVEFRKLNGHCDVPQRYPPNTSLGKWVHNQKQSYRKKDGRLNTFRMEALKAIGCSFI